MPETRITFLGASSALPTAAEDSASFLLRPDLLVDAGWSTVPGLLRLGVDPCALRWVVFTHFHQDHYLSLPALLFYRGMMAGRRGPIPPLTLLGPSWLTEAVDRSAHFLQAERFPEVWPSTEVRVLAPGDRVEAEEFTLEAARAFHPVEALCYRYTDRVTGAVAGFTGDTRYDPTLGEFFRGCDLLIHEASNPEPVDPVAAERWGHSSPAEAARVAREAGVRRLLLIHYPGDAAEQRLAAARAHFPASDLARGGLCVTVTRS